MEMVWMKADGEIFHSSLNVSYTDTVLSIGVHAGCLSLRKIQNSIHDSHTVFIVLYTTDDNNN